MRLLKHKEISIRVIINLTPIIRNTVSYKRRFIHEAINSLTDVISLVCKSEEIENVKNLVSILNCLQLASSNLLIAKELSIISNGFYETNERLLYASRADLRAMLKNKPEINRM